MLIDDIGAIDQRLGEFWSVHQNIGDNNLKAILVRDANGTPDGGKFQFVQVNGQGGAVVRFSRDELRRFIDFVSITAIDELEEMGILIRYDEVE